MFYAVGFNLYHEGKIIAYYCTEAQAAYMADRLNGIDASYKRFPVKAWRSDEYGSLWHNGRQIMYGDTLQAARLMAATLNGETGAERIVAEQEWYEYSGEKK